VWRLNASGVCGLSTGDPRRAFGLRLDCGILGLRDGPAAVATHTSTGEETPMRLSHIVLLAAAGILLAACAAGPNMSVDIANADGDVAGFWLGLWHGVISPITFLISLFTDDVTLYEVHNSGGWYDFGFVLGAGILFGGGFFGAPRAGRRAKRGQNEQV
jgi:hypothetical protein